MDLIIYGSIAYDRIMDFPGRFADHIIPSAIRKLNVSFMVHEFHETYGGAAGNIAYNLYLLKERPVIYASVGKDFGVYLQRLNNFKITTTGIRIYPQTVTPAAYILTDRNDNQITGFFPGAMNFYAKKPKSTKKDLAIIAPGNPNEMLDLADLFYRRQTPYIFDPGQQIIQFTKNQLQKVLRQSLIYIVNDYEAALTVKITGWDRQTLLKTAAVFITTLGKKGSTISINPRGNQLTRVNIKAVKSDLIKDPTGAGDAYRAGLIKGLIGGRPSFNRPDLVGLPWQMIGQMGSLAAVFAAEHYGTQSHQYSLNEFKKRYQLNFQTKLIL